MGKVLQFPGGIVPPGPVAEEHDDYPHKVYPMRVRKTGNDRWDPMPIGSWSNREFLGWYLGVITSQTRVAVEVRCAKPSGGMYRVRIGQRRPITSVPDGRVMDILMGVYEAASYLEDQ